MVMLTPDQLETLRSRYGDIRNALRDEFYDEGVQSMFASRSVDPVSRVLTDRLLHLCKAVYIDDGHHLLDDSTFQDILTQLHAYPTRFMYAALYADPAALRSWHHARLHNTYHRVNRSWRANFHADNTGTSLIPSFLHIRNAEIYRHFINLGGGIHKGPADPISNHGSRYHQVETYRWRVHIAASRFLDDMNPLLADFQNAYYEDVNRHFRAWVGFCWEFVRDYAEGTFQENNYTVPSRRGITYSLSPLEMLNIAVDYLEEIVDRGTAYLLNEWTEVHHGLIAGVDPSVPAQPPSGLPVHHQPQRRAEPVRPHLRSGPTPGD